MHFSLPRTDYERQTPLSIVNLGAPPGMQADLRVRIQRHQILPTESVDCSQHQ